MLVMSSIDHPLGLGLVYDVVTRIHPLVADETYKLIN